MFDLTFACNHALGHKNLVTNVPSDMKIWHMNGLLLSLFGTQYEAAHAIFGICRMCANAALNSHGDVSSEVRCLIVGLCLALSGGSREGFREFA